MAGFEEIALQIHPLVPEGGLGLGLRSLERPRELVFFVHHPHPAPAPAGGGLEDDRKPDLTSGFQRVALVSKLAGTAGEDWKPSTCHDLARLGFVTHQRDVFRGRTDEFHPDRLADFGEVGVLGEEAVTRVNGFSAGDFGGAEHVGDIAVAQGIFGRTNADMLIRCAHMP